VKVLETQRLVLRRLRLDDAAFIFELVNDPSWLRYIGDKDVKSSGEAIGICGFIKRDPLDDVDIGFAFLARHRGRGYAREAAAATLDYGRRELGLARIVAITPPDNEASIRVLETIGLRFEGGRELKLFATP
jgi:RimJ/RimL family protein N-acetyltransferase